jgi:signal transduction histidine kinase
MAASARTALLVGGAAFVTGAAVLTVASVDAAGFSLWAVAALVASSLLAWLYVRRLLEKPERELAEIAARTRDSRPGARPKPLATDDPAVARVAVAIGAFLQKLDRALSRHRLARLGAEDDERAETEFLTELSHELRTPLNAILGFTQVLLDEIDGPLSPSQREDVETIRTSGEHLGALVDDVLDMAALHSGHITLKRAPTDVASIVREVARLLEAQRRKKPVEIKVDLPAQLPHISADEKRVRQVVMNLGTNALKFTERGEVVLSAAAEPGGVRLTVRDTGPGIAPSEREQIFMEFTQVSSGVMRRAQGSGLGLAIVRRLTELHGGRISLESTMGEGSSFHVFLPREAP